MAFWDSAWSAISGAGSWLGNAAGAASEWMEKNKNATNIIGSTLMGVGGYFAQKEANKDLMKQQRELLNLQDRMKSKYSAVPDADTSYRNLVVDDVPNLANGGILTEMSKRSGARGV
ncbi:hypothetical protein HYE54_01045 [Aggregatibacter actinomycetemcomitans]|uniref:hypothetical protein n=1 Tax=Aggregatibacter actinomycetemcomitans TaxID=714 RepID=UPI00197BD79F|nr:hypothetical protein [Aggregatibacter actinomycetemcomitans]MBN6067404.1 hypothetical protein [Aggregatibacter actinomycetemcomitans]MBN6086094.1 hypothetical protein [Aggregatibacter actinomycetemcomitans]